MISVTSYLLYKKTEEAKLQPVVVVFYHNALFHPPSFFFFRWEGVLSYADQGRVGAANTPPTGQSSGAPLCVTRSCSPPEFQGFKDNNILMYKVYF